MTNEELKALIGWALQHVQNDPHQTYEDMALQVTADKLKSGHIFVEEWNTNVENAPVDKRFLVIVGEDYWIAVRGVYGEDDEWHDIAKGLSLKPLAYAELPSPPKVK